MTEEAVTEALADLENEREWMQVLGDSSEWPDE
jgi:hypothetical protein